MNPLQMGGVNIPFTEELFHQAKKMLKNSEAAKSALGEASDVYTPSEAAQQLPSSPQEKFLAEARSEISKMDPKSEGFVQQATSALVDSALGQVFGSKIAKNPGYPQMNAKITKKLLDEYSDVIGNFLAVLVQAKHQGLEGGESDANLFNNEIVDASDPVEINYSLDNSYSLSDELADGSSYGEEYPSEELVSEDYDLEDDNYMDDAEAEYDEDKYPADEMPDSEFADGEDIPEGEELLSGSADENGNYAPEEFSSDMESS